MNTTEFMYLDDKIDRKFSDNYVDTSELEISEDPTAWLSDTSFYNMTNSFVNIATDTSNIIIYTVGYSTNSSNAFTVLRFLNNTWTTLYNGTPTGFTKAKYLIFYYNNQLYLVRADGNGNEIWKSLTGASWSKCSYTTSVYIKVFSGHHSFTQIPGTPYVYIKYSTSDSYFRFIRLDLTNGNTNIIYMPEGGNELSISGYPCYPFYNRKDNCLSVLWSAYNQKSPGIYNYNDSTNSWTKIMDYTAMGNSYTAAAVYMPTANETYLFGSYSNYNDTSNQNKKVYKITGFQSVKELTQTPIGVDNHYSFIAYSRGEFHLLYNHGNGSSSSQLHYKFANSTKYIRKSLPVSYYNSGSAVAYGDYIYFLDSTSTKYFYRFDGESYEKIGVMPTTNSLRHCLVVYNNEIHMFSGTYHYKYNISNNTWTSVSTIGYTYTTGAASVVYNNQIHLLGGTGNYTAHLVWNGSSWSSKSSLPYEFNSGMAIVFNNNLYIIGGKNGNTSYNCYKYDNSGDFWYPVLSLPTSFSGGNAVVYKNNVHLFGGEKSATIHSSINPDTKRIYTYENMPIGMYAGDAVVYNNSIYLLGCGPYNNKEGDIMLKYTITSAT